ncbi:MAG TPA: AI-2E family transporter [Ktedonobacteraceae bacterium]|nr:AI-2E family transporter [Ktedonobacteraceae bacterium]
MEQVNWQRTRDILVSIICVGIIFWASWSILGLFFDAVVILLLSMAVAFLLTPAVNLLVKYSIPRLLATIIIYIVIIAVIGGFGYALVLTLVKQAVSFSTTITNFATALPDTFKSVINNLEKQGGIPAENINVAISQIQSTATDFARSLATNALNFVLIFTNALLNIVLVGVLSFYMTLDGQRIRDSLMGIIPRRWMPNALLFEDALNRVVGNYIRGQLTLALIVGICSGLICVFTGLQDYALIAGVLAFLFETIPMVGPALASITPIVLSLLLPGAFPRTFEIIVGFVLLQAIESNILGPRIVGHAVGLHPVAAILALLVGAKLFGVLGALLATPVVAATWVVIASIYRSARGETADQMLARKRPTWTLPRPTGQFTSRKRRAGGDFATMAGKKNHINHAKNAAHSPHDDNVEQPLRPASDTLIHTTLFQPVSVEQEEAHRDRPQPPERSDDEET